MNEYKNQPDNDPVERIKQVEEADADFARLMSEFRKMAKDSSQLYGLTDNRNLMRVYEVEEDGQLKLIRYRLDTSSKKVFIERIAFDHTDVVGTKDNHGSIVTHILPITEIDFSVDMKSEDYVKTLWADFLEYSDMVGPHRTSYKKEEPLIIPVGKVSNSKLVLGWAIKVGTKIAFGDSGLSYQVQYMRDGSLVLRSLSDEKMLVSLDYVRLIPEGIPREIADSILPLTILDLESCKSDIFKAQVLKSLTKPNLRGLMMNSSGDFPDPFEPSPN